MFGKVWTLLNNMNGWKAVITIILTVGSSYLGIKSDLATNKQQIDDFIIAQQRVDDKQDKQFADMALQLHLDLQHLGDKIDGNQRSRTR